MVSEYETFEAHSSGGCNECGDETRAYKTINGRDYCDKCAPLIEAELEVEAEFNRLVQPRAWSGEP